MSISVLISLLADAKFHSGQALGDALGVSRSAIYKQIKKLEQSGLTIHSVKGRGYRLAQPLELLDSEKIKASISITEREKLSSIHLHWCAESTNQIALQQANLKNAHAQVFIAEQQTAGRGRRGRSWHSPLAANVYCSLVWRFQQGAAALEGLSLLVGLSIERALQDLGVKQAQLKWPNDVLWQGRKLAGILLEMSGDASGDCQVIIGLGVNVNMPQQQQSIDQPWVDLQQILKQPVSRNQVLGAILQQLFIHLEQFSEQGFAPFVADWQDLHAYQNKQVRLKGLQFEVQGCCLGVDKSGALLIEVAGERQRFHAGELSLRAAL